MNLLKFIHQTIFSRDLQKLNMGVTQADIHSTVTVREVLWRRARGWTNTEAGVAGCLLPPPALHTLLLTTIILFIRIV